MKKKSSFVNPKITKESAHNNSVQNMNNEAQSLHGEIKFTFEMKKELHTKVKTYCSSKGMRMRNYIAKLIEKDMSERNPD